MRLQTIRVYSARGSCRVVAAKFTCFYRLTAGNACKLHVGFFTCEPHVNLPLLAGNFGHASFTVYVLKYFYELTS